ncbi:MAG: 6-carboxytetrahydropterin synthase QueD [Bacteroidales bacterium]
MAVIRLTKEFSFEMAHILDGYDGACKNVHGHSYKLAVTVIGEPISDPKNPKLGMVMDFGQLKTIVNKQVIDQFDHVLLVNSNSAILKQKDNGALGNIIAVNFQPTCEKLLEHIAKLIQQELPKEVKLHHIKLHETANSFAEWFASDNQ